MSIILKRTAVFILLLLFLYNTTCYYLVFEVMKNRIRREMQEKMEKGGSPLVILELRTEGIGSEYQRVDKKEIRYQGRMYDVIKEVRTGGITIFYCIHDKKEENLLATMKTMGTSKVLHLLWEQVIKIAIPQFTVPSPVINHSEISYPSICISFYSAPLSSDVPPPETACQAV